MSSRSPESRGQADCGAPKQIGGRSGKSRSKTHDVPQSTGSRLERKRAIDRDAQKAHRERNKAYVAHLEEMVEALKASNTSAYGNNELAKHLEQSQREVRTLQETLTSITRLASGLNHKMSEWEAKSASSSVVILKDSTNSHTSPDENGTDTVSLQMHPDSMHTWIANSPTGPAFAAPAVPSAAFPIDSVVLLESRQDPDARSTETANAAYRFPWTSGSSTGASSTGDYISGTINDHNRPSIGQLGTRIMSISELNGKRWYLAGALLSHILNDKERPEMSTCNDEDIAIRAVLRGWSEVQTRYCLDIGWQWLREVDENLYLDVGKPARLQTLRNCRMMLLHQLNPGVGYDKMLPAFFASRPSQLYLRHDPLIEHFPWPAFRERLMFQSQVYMTDNFMDSFRKHMHVIWPCADSELYAQDRLTGLYSYSAAFDHCTNDIRRYTCRADFFSQFPELLADIPQDCPSPRAMTCSELGKENIFRRGGQEANFRTASET
ncbi:hypothetical protein LTR56_006236 [Elasticomyces elasticus]|nr:hypothetical protein LTR56_006236 [Elasticomyces elasticus]KAK4928312.1 hypothetical protein LTR49_004989 [Elasticomyces elasticus]KAK5763875.1 hypothetical protein LTS12_005993 [Elasticomyces elasticus]